MGFLDSIITDVVGSVLSGATRSKQDRLGTILSGMSGGNPARGSNVLAAVMSLLDQHGGLDAVLDQFRRSGLGEQADSWVSTGPNKEISAEQLQKVLGTSAVSKVASELGLSQGQTASGLADLVPELINQLTPQGQLPQNHQDLIAKGLAMLRGSAV